MSEQYLSSSQEEPRPLMSVLVVPKLIPEEVDKIAEACSKDFVYYGEGYGDGFTVVVGGHHEEEEFVFLGENRGISLKKVFGWPKGFPRIIIPPSRRGLNLTPFHRGKG